VRRWRGRGWVAAGRGEVLARVVGPLLELRAGVRDIHRRPDDRPTRRARNPGDRLGRLEGLPAIRGEVDLGPNVRVRLAVLIDVLGEERSGGEAGRHAGRKPQRSGHDGHGAGVVLAEAALALGIEEEVVHHVTVSWRTVDAGGV